MLACRVVFPVFFYHGTHDEVVPVAHVEMYERAFLPHTSGVSTGETTSSMTTWPKWPATSVHWLEFHAHDEAVLRPGVQ